MPQAAAAVLRTVTAAQNMRFEAQFGSFRNFSLIQTVQLFKKRSCKHPKGVFDVACWL
jgi:hypothetical protein